MKPETGRNKSFLKVIEILEETYKEPINIVETGCIRNTTDESKFGDGWSTLNWQYYCNKTNSKLYVVDINQGHILKSKEIVPESELVQYTLSDSIEYLQNFDKKIDLLFADSFDYCGDAQNIFNCHTHSLNEIKAAWDKLSENCFILIDDVFSDNWDGKGKFSIPYLLENGFELVYFMDSQALLKRKKRRLPTEYVKTRKEYILFKNDCGVSDITRRGGIYEHYLFDYIRNNVYTKGKTIIDIGANFGFHTLEFADLVEDGNVVSFEPQKLVFYQLCGNIVLNGHDNVTAHNIALSNEHTILKMENMPYHSTETINIGSCHLDAYCDNHYNFVEVRTLDSYQFENVAVIKIDAQGCEPKILDGAIETIKKHKPIIFIEIIDSELQIYDSSEKDVFNRLDALGYTYKKIIEADHLVDYVAIPKSILL